MKRFREKHPLLASLIIIALMFVGLPAGNLLVGIVIAVPPLAEFLGDYGIQLLAELGILVVMVLMTFLWKMERVFTCRGRGFGQSLLPAAPLLALYAIAGVESLMFGLEGLMLGDGSPLQNPLHILLFVLCMAAVGITEELTFRGMIAGMFYEKYGETPAGVWLSVMASSLLFGLVHITNAIGGAASLSGVLIQMVGAIALGMCLAALYFRCRNLWAVAVVHGFMDFCALLTSGVFQEDSLTYHRRLFRGEPGELRRLCSHCAGFAAALLYAPDHQPPGQRSSHHHKAVRDHRACGRSGGGRDGAQCHLKNHIQILQPFRAELRLVKGNVFCVLDGRSGEYEEYWDPAGGDVSAAGGLRK